MRFNQARELCNTSKVRIGLGDSTDEVRAIWVLHTVNMRRKDDEMIEEITSILA